MLGKLADQIDAEIKKVKASVLSQSDLQELDTDLCSCAVDGVMQEARTLMGTFRDRWREWDASKRKGG